ncbi:MAG: bifunctional methylenetetrahydrofolate dehydrogenase/methenyltetrahydrofolate cyclohydrolase FolD [Alphaproteobacteria bacterium]
MSASIIDGRAISADVRALVGRQAADLKARHGLVPGLTVVLVGEDPASQVYVRNKGKAATEAGIASNEIRLPATVSQAEVEDTVAKLNADPAVHGILVQLPLPDGLDEAPVIAAIDPDKDVDGLHVVNAGRLVAGLPGLVPCTPRGTLILIDRAMAGKSVEGLHAVVIGRSLLFGKPMAQLLLSKNCTVTMAHSRTRDLPAVARMADLLVVAVGRQQMVKDDWVKPGAVVIDVGINRIPKDDGKTRLVGDVDFDAVKEVAGAITPVPGGVGPMTIACLLQNTITAACHQAGVEEPAG